MTIRSLRDLYADNLSKRYPPSEIRSIFALLAQCRLGFDRVALTLEGTRKLSSTDLVFFKDCLKRLQKNEPVQYILGETSFYDLTFKVNSDVLIPRPETEELVRWVLSDIEKYFLDKEIRIIDIGTGSGCIAISLAKNLPRAKVWAMDISGKALHVAKENALNNEVSIQFIQADILQLKELPGNFSIIISNPPYVRQQEQKKMHDNVLQFEPDEALYVPDENPLLFYRRISDLAKKHLAQNGKLYFEINQYLGKETLQLLKENGFTNLELRKDLLGNERMLRGGFSL